MTMFLIENFPIHTINTKFVYTIITTIHFITFGGFSFQSYCLMHVKNKNRKIILFVTKIKCMLHNGIANDEFTIHTK